MLGVYPYMTFCLNNNKLYLYYEMYDICIGEIDTNELSKTMNGMTDTVGINRLNQLYLYLIEI